MRCELYACSCIDRKELSDKYGEAIRKNCRLVTKEGATCDNELIVVIDDMANLIQLEKDISELECITKSRYPYSGLIIDHQWDKDMLKKGIECIICIADYYLD